MMAGLDLDDIQGLIARGYGNLRAARYALLHVRDGAAARAWLDRTIDSITPASRRPTDGALHIAFTPSGLAALGLDQQALAGFSNEFARGMTTPHRRRILGDVEESAPERWDWTRTGAAHTHYLAAGRGAPTSTPRSASPRRATAAAT